jgi:hypothetical protein
MKMKARLESGWLIFPGIDWGGTDRLQVLGKRGRFVACRAYGRNVPRGRSMMGMSLEPRYEPLLHFVFELVDDGTVEEIISFRPDGRDA